MVPSPGRAQGLWEPKTGPSLPPALPGSWTHCCPSCIAGGPQPQPLTSLEAQTQKPWGAVEVWTHPCLRLSPNIPPSPGPALNSWEFLQFFWKLLFTWLPPGRTCRKSNANGPAGVSPSPPPATGDGEESPGWQWKRPVAPEDWERGLGMLGSPSPSHGARRGASLLLKPSEGGFEKIA